MVFVLPIDEADQQMRGTVGFEAEGSAEVETTQSDRQPRVRDSWLAPLTISPKLADEPKGPRGGVRASYKV